MTLTRERLEQVIHIWERSDRVHLNPRDVLVLLDERDTLRAQLATARAEALREAADIVGDMPADGNIMPRMLAEIGSRILVRALAIAPAAKPRRCPTCDSHNPALHPAVQLGGEVQYCSDPWHGKHAAKPITHAEQRRWHLCRHYIPERECSECAAKSTPDAKCGGCGGSKRILVSLGPGVRGMRSEPCPDCGGTGVRR